MLLPIDCDDEQERIVGCAVQAADSGATSWLMEGWLLLQQPLMLQLQHLHSWAELRSNLLLPGLFPGCTKCSPRSSCSLELGRM